MSKQTVVLGIAVVVLGVGAWMGVSGASRSSPPESKEAAMPPALSVSVIKAEHKALDDDIRVIGTIVPREKVVVLSEMAGLRVRAVYADTGDYVRKGQKLALLDGESLNIQIQSLQAEFERTKEEYNRSKALETSGAISKESLRQGQAAFEVARSKLLDTQLSITRTQIVAPTDGFIYERAATIGGLTSATDPLFRIARDGEVEMEASVPEALVRRLKPGMPVSVTVAGDSTPIAASVRLIVPFVDNTSRASGVRIRFASGHKAPVGVFSEARITVDKVSGWVLPGTALQQDAQGSYVWQVGPQNAVARKSVTILNRTADSAVIKEALADAAIVAKAGSFLREGDQVALVRP